MKKNLWYFIFLLFFILLFFDAVKFNLGLTFRLAQPFILGLFILVIINDLRKKTLNIPLLLFLFGSGIILTFISLNSIHEKIYEYKFIIKYLTLFPASFYLGYKIFSFINIKEFLKIIETSAIVHSLIALIFYFYPISFLMHERGALTGYQGTFWESTGLGATIGLFFLISISLRYEFKINFKNYIYAVLFYIFLLYTIVMTKSKTFWMGLSVITIYIIIFKPILLFLNYQKLYRYKFFQKFQSNLPTLAKLKTVVLTFSFIFIAMLFFIINSTMENPIVSKEMIETKLQHERGKALITALNLLSDSNWLGGYGWGFVESYFNTHNIDILGLGGDVGMMFNSYLNEWISVGILGLIFHIVLLILAFSNRYLFTSIVPIYLFVSANVHPIVGGETYYLFLGLSYGFKKYMENREIENA